MINKTTWYPDTCDCIVEYEWNSEDPPEIRQHILSKFVKQCEFHKNLDSNLAFSTILSECKTKNYVINNLLTTIPRFATTLMNGGIVVKEGIEIKYNFIGEGNKREIEIEIVGDTLTLIEKQNVELVKTGQEIPVIYK